MLKAKKGQLSNKNKLSAYKEVSKIDNTNRLYALVPKQAYLKLQRELSRRDIYYRDWLIEAIENIKDI